MTKVRAYAVCEDSLYKVALKHNFSDFLYLGKSERTSDSNKKAILADCVEAVIAAITASTLSANKAFLFPCEYCSLLPKNKKSLKLCFLAI